MNKKHTGKQVIAMVFLVCFMAVSLLTEAFVLTHTHHEHDHQGVGGTCTACAQLRDAEDILKQLGTAVACVCFSWAGLSAISTIISAVCSRTAFLTPVTLKNKMNN